VDSWNEHIERMVTDDADDDVWHLSNGRVGSRMGVFFSCMVGRAEADTAVRPEGYFFFLSLIKMNTRDVSFCAREVYHRLLDPCE